MPTQSTMIKRPKAQIQTLDTPKWIQPFLYRDKPALADLFRLTALTLFPAISVSVLLYALAPPPTVSNELTPAVLLWRILSDQLHAIGETALMVLVFRSLLGRGLRGNRLAWASALVFAALHLFNGLGKFIVVLWPFYVFSICFSRYRTISEWRAFAVTAQVHMLHNALCAFFYIIPFVV